MGCRKIGWTKWHRSRNPCRENLRVCVKQPQQFFTCGRNSQVGSVTADKSTRWQLSAILCRTGEVRFSVHIVPVCRPLRGKCRGIYSPIQRICSRCIERGWVNAPQVSSPLVFIPMCPHEFKTVTETRDRHEAVRGRLYVHKTPRGDNIVSHETRSAGTSLCSLETRALAWPATVFGDGERQVESGHPVGEVTISITEAKHTK